MYSFIHAPPCLLERAYMSAMKIASCLPSASNTSNTRTSGLYTGRSLRSLNDRPYSLPAAKNTPLVSTLFSSK
jgi:hypothetical protein